MSSKRALSVALTLLHACFCILINTSKLRLGSPAQAQTTLFHLRFDDRFVGMDF